MGILSTIYAAIRSTARRAYSGSASQELDMNRGGDLMVAQGLPSLTSVVSMGGSWVTQVKTADATSPVNAIPTTTADFQLYNAAALGSGICLVIDSVFLICQTSEGAADFFSLVGQVIGPGGAAAPTAYASVVSSMNGKGINYAGSATRAQTVTTALTNGWFALGNSVNTAALTATKGLVVDADCAGRYVIPPTGSFMITPMASAVATNKVCVGVRWHEVVLDLG